MNNLEFKAGDKVFHLSDSSVIWVIESIEGDYAICSTLLRETKEQKKEKFAFVVLGKVPDGSGMGIYFGEKKRNNHY